MERADEVTGGFSQERAFRKSAFVVVAVFLPNIQLSILRALMVDRANSPNKLVFLREK